MPKSNRTLITVFAQHLKEVKITMNGSVVKVGAKKVTITLRLTL